MISDNLVCVNGFRYDKDVIKDEDLTYLADWSYAMWKDGYSAGNTVDNQNACWKKAKENVSPVLGIFLVFNEPSCRAITDVRPLLPWPNSFPTDKKSHSTCILESLANRKG